MIYTTLCLDDLTKVDHFVPTKYTTIMKLITDRFSSESLFHYGLELVGHSPTGDKNL